MEHDGTSLEHIAAVGDPKFSPREYRRPLLADVADRLKDCLNQVGREAHGRAEASSFGLAISARPSASVCGSPPCGARCDFCLEEGAGSTEPAPSPAHYLRTSTNSNLQPIGVSALTTLKPDMTSMVVSPFASKLHLPLRPSKSLVAAMAALIFSRSFASARLIASITTYPASQE